MITSARNHFIGIIKEINEGPVNAIVSLMLPGGTLLAAVITKESVKKLQLTTGKKAHALIKANQVLLGIGDIRVSARNILKGTIAELVSGPVNCEVKVALSDGTEVASIITGESRKKLNLNTGSEVSCIFKASSLLLAVD